MAHHSPSPHQALCQSLSPPLPSHSGFSPYSNPYTQLRSGADMLGLRHNRDLALCLVISLAPAGDSRSLS